MNAHQKTYRPLRVAIFSGNYNYVMDGPVRALNRLVDYLEKMGHEVLVFAPTAKKPAFQHAGTLISVPSVSFPGKRSEYRFGLGLHGKAKRRLEAFKPTLIHIAAPDYTGHNALKYAEKNNIPAVASFHTRFDTYPRYYKARWAEKYVANIMRKFYARCQHVYAPSQSMIDELRGENIGRDIRLWSRGVDSDLFNPNKRDAHWRAQKGFAEDDVVVAFVGRLVLEKGINVFADAFLQAQRQKPTLKALIVGDGPERKNFEEKLPGAVFEGYLQGADLARAYANADIFFNPSITETFGNVTLEAMASGLPSICAAAAGSKSLVEDNVTGFLSIPNPIGFTEKLTVLGADAFLRKRFGAAARAQGVRTSWDSVLADLVDHYNEAIAQHASARLRQKDKPIDILQQDAA